MKKKIPVFETDKDLEQFVEDADLTEYDLSHFKPVHFELRKKDKQINLRLPEGLLEALKTCAAQNGIPYQRLIRQAIEDALKVRNVDA